MSTNNYYQISKDKIEEYLSELGKLINRKRSRSFRSEIIIVGGASILLNYGFRVNSNYIDCSDRSGILMNDIIDEVGTKYNLPKNWINTDFVHTKSYSQKLDQYSTFYKSYGYGALDVRTIKDEYLIAMKIVSARKYRNDFSDIYGIITECRNKNIEITFEKVTRAIIDLYGSIDIANKLALDFTKKIIEDPESVTYQSIKEQENLAASEIRKIEPDNNLELENIDYILSKLDF